MIVQSLSLSNFRNYELQTIDFHRGINIFYGDNAQGKTNILEAIYLCSTNKSYRGSKDKDMIRFGSEEAHLKLLGEKQEIPYRIDFHLKRNKTKGIAVNSVPIRKSGELLGLLHVVFFSPEDLQLIKNGPAERRRFVDMELCQLDRLYMQQLVGYNRCLQQRNTLLKDLVFHPENLPTLDIWDQQLCDYGKQIIRQRERFVEEIAPFIKKIHFQLSGGKEELFISYEPNTEPDMLEEAMRKGRERDQRMKLTMTGPHRDDIRFLVKTINGNGMEQMTDIRTFGSQGQQRTAALSVKMAEIEMVKQKVKDAPVLLLDDVLSELDSSRQTYLLDGIRDIQTMITCTGLDDLVSHRFHMDQVFHVENGTVTKISSNAEG